MMTPDSGIWKGGKSIIVFLHGMVTVYLHSKQVRTLHLAGINSKFPF